MDIPRIKVFYDGSNPSLFVHFQLFRPNQIDHCTAGFELERNLSRPVAKDLLTSAVTKQNIGVAKISLVGKQSHSLCSDNKG